MTLQDQSDDDLKVAKLTNQMQYLELNNTQSVESQPYPSLPPKQNNTVAAPQVFALFERFGDCEAEKDEVLMVYGPEPDFWAKYERLTNPKHNNNWRFLFGFQNLNNVSSLFDEMYNMVNLGTIFGTKWNEIHSCDAFTSTLIECLRPHEIEEKLMNQKRLYGYTDDQERWTEIINQDPESYDVFERVSKLPPHVLYINTQKVALDIYFILKQLASLSKYNFAVGNIVPQATEPASITEV